MAQDTGNWVGLTLANRFRIAGQLGAGGMAFVYLAHDREQDRQVVVKVPRQAMLEDPEFVGRFRREARSLVRLAHPNIVRILDAGDHEGRPFLILDYLSGGSLRDRMSQGRRPSEELETWLPGIAAALDFCHENGCVHRDVKPDNILFDARGAACLSDFGIAKVVRDRPNAQMTVMTGEGLVLGTAQYMAPELVLGKPFDGRVDQYGLAVTVYEVLSGKIPFSGNTPAAVYVELATKDAPPLSRIAPDIPKELADATQRAMSKDPRERFSDCRSFAQAILDTAFVVAMPVGGAASPREGIDSGSRSRGQQTARPRHKSEPAETPRAAPQADTDAGEAEIVCPRCHAAFAVAPSMLGKKGKCPGCRVVIPLARKNREPVTTRFQPLPTDVAPRAHSTRNAVWILGGVAGFLAIALVVLVCLLSMSGSGRTPNQPGAGFPPVQGMPQEPQLRLSATTPEVNVMPGRSATIRVTLDRDGFKGKIELDVVGTPNGITAKRRTSTVTSTKSFSIDIAAAAGTAPQRVLVKIVATPAGGARSAECEVQLVVAASSGIPPKADAASTTVFKQQDQLTALDPIDATRKLNTRFKAYNIELDAGVKYTITLTGSSLDPFLRLEDNQGLKLAENDDAPGLQLGSRIVFTPTQTGTYRIIATELFPRLGAFTLTVTR